MAADTPKGTILVVEDDPVFRALYANLFKLEGFRVREETNGKTGYETAVQEKPAAILLDIMMPVQGGLEMLKQLRANPDTQSIPVIIMSALGEQKDVTRGLECGANDYTIKGYHKPKEILGKIQALLGLAAQAQPYNLTVNDVKGDAIKLKRDLKLDGAFECPHCRTAMSLQLLPDAAHIDSRWFVGRFFCAKCAKAY